MMSVPQNGECWKYAGKYKKLANAANKGRGPMVEPLGELA
jgi:hypothetical protein